MDNDLADTPRPEAKPQDILLPLKTDARVAAFVDHVNIDMRNNSVRLVFGQQTAPGVVVPIASLSMAVGDVLQLAGTMQRVAAHYQEVARNASRIITTPKQ